VWRLGEAELEAATRDPPAELVPLASLSPGVQAEHERVVRALMGEVDEWERLGRPVAPDLVEG
jgi:hypothetical protein